VTGKQELNHPSTLITLLNMCRFCTACVALNHLLGTGLVLQFADVLLLKSTLEVGQRHRAFILHIVEVDGRCGCRSWRKADSYL
jgi:hypothetical protein